MKIDTEGDLRNLDFCLSTFTRCVKRRDWLALERLLNSPLFKQAMKTFKTEFPELFEQFRAKISGDGSTPEGQ